MPRVWIGLMLVFAMLVFWVGPAFADGYTLMEDPVRAQAAVGYKGTFAQPVDDGSLRVRWYVKVDDCSPAYVRVETPGGVDILAASYEYTNGVEGAAAEITLALTVVYKGKSYAFTDTARLMAGN